jgi:hypothetical protein
MTDQEEKTPQAAAEVSPAPKKQGLGWEIESQLQVVKEGALSGSTGDLSPIYRDA